MPGPSGTTAHRASWLRPALFWLAIVAIAVGIGRYATPPEIPRPPGGMQRMLPRVPGPAPNFRTLLYLLGVGSIVWYAAAVALPLLVLGARRIDLRRLGRMRAIGIATTAVATLIAITSISEYVAIYQGSPVRPGFAAYLPQALRQNVLPWLRSPASSSPPRPGAAPCTRPSTANGFARRWRSNGSSPSRDSSIRTFCSIPSRGSRRSFTAIPK